MNSVGALLFQRRTSIAGILLLGLAVLEPRLASANTCTTVAACIFGENVNAAPGSGIGNGAAVSGRSSHGDGVDGATTFKSSSSVAKSGVAGYDMSSTGSYNSGVAGYSRLGRGLHGSTNAGTGVLGAATTSGTGVDARSSSGTALALKVTSGYGLTIKDAGNPSHLSTGVSIGVIGDGITIGNDYGGSFNSSAGSKGSGVSLESAGGDALDLNASGTGIPLMISGHSSNGIVLLAPGSFSLDSGGNMVLSGGVTTYGSAAHIARTAAGVRVRTYALREAEATLEDLGETTIVGGRATVALDPTFAGAMDTRKPYYVFLTAEGDSRGLYVTAKTARSFAIREASGGTSTLDVHYRIVAKPLDASGTGRLANVDPSQLAYASAAARNRAALMRAHAAKADALLRDLQSHLH